MNSIVKKVFTYLIFPVIIAGLTYAIVQSIMEPVEFKKYKEYRESIAIQRLKDIRDLQVAYKNVNGKFTSTVDSLIMFYNDGKMKIALQVGSKDDSLAMANTQKYTRRWAGLKKEKVNQKLYELYLSGEQNLVFEVTSEIPVKDTLFIMASAVKTVSGVKVPLFEASMPYKSLLKGLNNQLRINLDAEREDQGKYKGLQVGSIAAPNNNAGNWE